MRHDSKPTVMALIICALAIWGFNARELFHIQSGKEPGAVVADLASDIDLQERMRILSGSGAPVQTPLRWDPFAQKSLVKSVVIEKAEPHKPAPVPKAPAKPQKPPVPPFQVEYIGFAEATQSTDQVMILRWRNILWFLEANEWLGPWQLKQVAKDLLVFQDENGHSVELAR